MDNLSVTVAAGAASAWLINRRLIFEVAFLFSGAHFVMFTIGFLGGESVAPALGRVAPWIASAALVYIGVRMLFEAYRNETEVNHALFSAFKNKLLLALATSLDAFLVGTSFGFTYSAFWQMAIMMVLCVWITSVLGFKLGNVLGKKFGRWTEAVGGLVIIGMGLKLLI